MRHGQSRLWGFGNAASPRNTRFAIYLLTRLLRLATTTKIPTASGSPGTSAAPAANPSLILRLGPADLLGSARHNRDFSGSRGDIITARLRYLSPLAAILFPVWIPIDAWLLGEHFSYSLAAYRLLAALACGALFLSVARERHSLAPSLARLALFFATVALFFVAARLNLDSVGQGIARVETSYRYFPYIMAAMLAVFPLTLFEGLLFSAGVVAVTLVVQAFLNTPLDVTVLELWLLGVLCAIAVWVQISQLQMLLRLYLQATYDPLTRLLNRRVFIDRLEEAARQAKASGSTLSLLMFDLDRFKRINDTHGHLGGDDVLRRFSELLLNTLGDDATVCRYGGEEFVAVLPGRGQDEARVIADEIRRGCHQYPARAPDAVEIRYTTSVGVAERDGDERPTDLLNRVDQALYEAKAGGRDMVVVADGKNGDHRQQH